MKMKLALLAVGICCTVNAAEAKTRLIVNCFWPPQHFICNEILPNWLDEVKKVTEGRVVGNIPPKSVSPPPEQLASVQKGIVDAAVQFNGLIQNQVKGPLVAMQPFSGSFNAPAMSQALWETNRKYFPDELKSVQLLTQFVITPAQLFSTTDKPLHSLADFASRKVWILPGPLATIGKTLGAGVVATPAVKANEIISRGIVDAHLGLDGTSLRSNQLLPYTKSMTRFSKAIYSTSFSFVVNKDKWADISAEDQAAIMKISGAKLGIAAATKWDTIAKSVYDSFDKEGIKIIDADPEFEKALIDAAAPITNQWKLDATAAGIDAEAAFSFYQERVVELSK